jgi:hypothetical protein
MNTPPGLVLLPSRPVQKAPTHRKWPNPSRPIPQATNPLPTENQIALENTEAFPELALPGRPLPQKPTMGA